MLTTSPPTVIISVILPIFLLPAALISAVFFFIGRLYIR